MSGRVLNRAKHGIGFDVAITAFDDPFALVAPDPSHSTSEPRVEHIDSFLIRGPKRFLLQRAA